MNRMKVFAFGAESPVHHRRFHQASNVRTTTLTTLKSSPIGAKRLMTFNSGGGDEVVLPEKISEALRGMRDTIADPNLGKIHSDSLSDSLVEGMLKEKLVTPRFPANPEEFWKKLQLDIPEQYQISIYFKSLLAFFPELPFGLLPVGVENHEKWETEEKPFIQKIRSRKAQIVEYLNEKYPATPLQKALSALHAKISDTCKVQNIIKGMQETRMIDEEIDAALAQARGILEDSMHAKVNGINQLIDELEEQIVQEIRKRQA